MVKEVPPGSSHVYVPPVTETNSTPGPISTSAHMPYMTGLSPYGQLFGNASYTSAAGYLAWAELVGELASFQSWRRPRG